MIQTADDLIVGLADGSEQPLRDCMVFDRESWYLGLNDTLVSWLDHLDDYQLVTPIYPILNSKNHWRRSTCCLTIPNEHDSALFKLRWL